MAAAVGSIRVGVDTDLRTIAKHAQACADELEQGPPAFETPAIPTDQEGPTPA